MATFNFPIDVERVIKVTNKAILLRIDGDQHWFPKSQMEDPDLIAEGDEGLTVYVTEWIAEQKDFL